MNICKAHFLVLGKKISYIYVLTTLIITLLKIENNDKEIFTLQPENERLFVEGKTCICEYNMYIYIYVYINIYIHKHTHKIPKWNTPGRSCRVKPTREMTSLTHRVSNHLWWNTFLSFMQQPITISYLRKISFRTYRKQISKMTLE